MDFKKAIAQEKKRIKSEFASHTKRIAVLQKELDALLAYESAQKTVTPSAPKKRGTPVTKQILRVLKGKSMKPKEIKSALPRVKPQTISNTLSTMKRKGTLKHKDGEYSVA